MYRKLFTAALLSHLFLLSPLQAAEKVAPPKSAVQQKMQKVNINTATAAQLSTLKGIGDAKAKAIVDYRSQHGKFSSINELVSVKGIGAKIIEQNKAILALK